MKKVKLIEVKSEIGAGTRGASLGVDAIKIAALDYGSTLFRQFESVEVPTENQLLFESPGSPYAKRIRGIISMCEEVAVAIKNPLKNNEFPSAEVKRNGVEKIARDALAYLNHCNLIYISFDVDSMDSSISKGTGTPVRHGITEKEAGSLIVRLIQNERVCCFEIAEVNPTLDKENLMAENTFEILQRAVSQLTY